MKIKKIIPLFAIAIGLVLAVAASGFREETKTDPDLYSFEFLAPGGTDFSDDAVMDVSNWHFTSNDDPCNGLVKACKITVTGGYKTGSNPATYALSSSINIQAAENGSGVARVTAIADQNGSYSNKN